MSTETTIIGIALSGDPTVLIDLDNIHPHHFADIITRTRGTLNRQRILDMNWRAIK